MIAAPPLEAPLSQVSVRTPASLEISLGADMGLGQVAGTGILAPQAKAVGETPRALIAVTWQQISALPARVKGAAPSWASVTVHTRPETDETDPPAATAAAFSSQYYSERVKIPAEFLKETWYPVIAKPLLAPAVQRHWTLLLATLAVLTPMTAAAALPTVADMPIDGLLDPQAFVA